METVYQNNLRHVMQLLSNDNLKNIEQLRLDFIKGYYEILKLSFDLNISTQDLELIAKRGITKQETQRLIILNIENPTTYSLLNEYLEEVIKQLC